MGYDVWAVSDISSPGSAVNGWNFGDFSAFTIVDVGGLRVQAGSDSLFGNRQLAIGVIRKVASHLPDVTAIAYQTAANLYS